MRKYCHLARLAFALILLLFVFQPEISRAQPPSGWSKFENISRTPTSSSFPSAAADRFGQIHVVWSEDVGGVSKNLKTNPDGTPLLDFRGKQVNLLNLSGNTVFYTRWDGKKWATPVDIQTIAPPGHTSFTDIAVDSKGVVHLIWTKASTEISDLMYSQAPGNAALSVRSWSSPLLLASNLLTTYYPLGITIDPLDGLHVIYGAIGLNPGTYVINSLDDGKTWSDPVQIYASKSRTGTEDGTQPVRITADTKNRLHAMWTVYGESGTGKYIYYAQSLDQGNTWSKPFLVAAWQEGWYEVDWLNVGVVGDQVHAVWEGGPVSYHNERISNDGGQTWGPAYRIFTRLAGENGWSDLVADHQGSLYQLLVKRISSGAGTIYSVWYSQFHDDQWQTPQIVGINESNFYNDSNEYSSGEVQNLFSGTITGDGLRHQRGVILNGNELFCLVVNEFDGEIYASHLNLNLPYIPPAAFSTSAVTETKVPTQAVFQQLEPTQSLLIQTKEASSTNPGALVLASLIPVILLVVAVFFIRRYSLIRKV
jgi:hypothetical protein